MIEKNITFKEIVLSYTNNPRDVKTVPLNREGIWFYVYVENENIYVDKAKNHANSSKVKNRMRIPKEQFDTMLSLYHRRNQGVFCNK